MELFNAIFSSFWTWSGTLLLVGAFGGSIARVIHGFREWRADR